MTIIFYFFNLFDILIKKGKGENMKKTIEDYELNNKKVIMRCDFNVPIKDGIIQDDNRIVQSLTSIKYALEHGAKLILMSHLGKIKEEADKEKNTLSSASFGQIDDLPKKSTVFQKTRKRDETNHRKLSVFQIPLSSQPKVSVYMKIKICEYLYSFHL